MSFVLSCSNVQAQEDRKVLIPPSTKQRLEITCTSFFTVRSRELSTQHLAAESDISVTNDIEAVSSSVLEATNYPGVGIEAAVYTVFVELVGNSTTPPFSYFKDREFGGLSQMYIYISAF